jgi:hypothetical protein
VRGDCHLAVTSQLREALVLEEEVRVIVEVVEEFLLEDEELPADEAFGARRFL